jgi:hypothetical protein
LPKLPVDQAQRQGRITFLALNALGRDGALLFLNSHDGALGGRPLDLATATVKGFDAIACAIAAQMPATTST